MAVNSSFPILESGNNSSHGEMFRLVYEKDACLDAVSTTAVGSVLYWAWNVPVVDGPQPISGTFPPVAPTAATNANELYAAATGFPTTAHQQNNGTCSYGLMGVSQLNTNTTKIGLPAGIVVVNDYAGSNTAMTRQWESVATAAEQLGLVLVKTRGIVQALVDGTTDVAVGDYLEGTNGQYYLIQDAGNGNEGTFIALEARTTNSADMMYVCCINLVY